MLSLFGLVVGCLFHDDVAHNRNTLTSFFWPILGSILGLRVHHRVPVASRR